MRRLSFIACLLGIIVAVASPVRSVIGGRNTVMVNGENLPYDAEVEYLDSTGMQWIDTGISNEVYPSLGYRIKLNPLVSGNFDGVVKGFCGYSNYGSRFFGVNFTSLNSRGLQIGLAASGRYDSSDMELCDHIIHVSSEAGAFLDGVEIGMPYNNDVSREGTTFLIFAVCARDGSGVNHITPRQCRIYSLTMYNGNDVISDFIPVRKDGIGYMYDKISGEFFGNVGTGDFIIGPDK